MHRGRKREFSRHCPALHTPSITHLIPPPRSQTMRAKTIDYLLLLLLAFIWSGSFLLIKIGVASVGPFTLTAARMSIAAVVLVLWLAVKKTGLPWHGRAVALYVVVGVFGNTLPFALIGWGETHIDSSLAAIMMGIMPITTFVLAHYFVSAEPINGRKTFGVALGLSGLLVLVGWSAVGGIGEHVLGQLAVLAAAISYGVTTVFVRTQPAFPGVQMATGAIIVGMVTSLPLAFWLEDPWSMAPSAHSVQAIVALGVIPTAFAALLYFRLIRNLGAIAFSQLNYMIPILGSVWGALLLRELLQARMLAALCLVLAGIYFTQPRNPVRAASMAAKASDESNAG